jgi:hypothetical protein
VRTESVGELDAAELDTGVGSPRLSLTDGIGVGSGKSYGSADDLRLWKRAEPSRAIWLVRGEQWQARSSTRKLPPSIRGLFDLHGNLFEWTHDWIGTMESKQ